MDIRALFWKLVVAVMLMGCVAILVVGTAYFSVRWNSRNKVFYRTGDIPYCRVGLVLGTSPFTATGRDNYFFTTRMNAAAELYKAGKVSKLILSGDNHSKSYDEPTYMKKALIARGVPASAIVLDYAGFRTLDSVVRAKEIFGQTRLVIISQRFHNERAIWIAEHYGVDAIGFNAKDARKTKRSLMVTHVRESLSRVKMFLDLLFHKQPKFLGEKIKI